ncbi:hypothetical protein FKM82_013621 [Ascaphus truei]
MMKTFPCFLLLIQVFFNEAIIQQNKRKQGIVNQTLSKVKFQLTDDEANEHRLRKRNRFRRQDSTNIQCRDDSGYDETAQHCCKNCPVGEHVQAACLIAEQDPTCIACDSGTYLGYPSYRDKCIRCLHCDTATQIIMKNCSATSNTQCSCKEGTYQVKGNDGPCHMCTECQNRKVIKHCSKTENTECGQCLPGFYEVKNECRSCLQLPRKQCDNETHEDCAKLCASVTPNPPMYIVIGALLFLLLPIGGLLHHQHKRKKKDTLTASGEHIFTLVSYCILLILRNTDTLQKKCDGIFSAFNRYRFSWLIWVRNSYYILGFLFILFGFQSDFIKYDLSDRLH